MGIHPPFFLVVVVAIAVGVVVIVIGGVVLVPCALGPIMPPL
jgi:hypothetical protein